MGDRRDHVTRLAWCPTRPGLLGALVEGDGVVQLYDTRHDAGTDLEAWTNKPISRRATHRRHPPHVTLAGFDWHPTLRNRIMTISKNGALDLSTAPEQVCCTFSPSDVLCCGTVGELDFVGARECNTTTMQGTALKMTDAITPSMAREIPPEDISSVMRRRALVG